MQQQSELVWKNIILTCLVCTHAVALNQKSEERCLIQPLTLIA